MTKRISQPTTVVVPVSQAPVADGAAVAAKVAAVPAEAEAAVKADVVVEKAPVTVTVVADPAMALVAPAPLAMVAAEADAGQDAAAASTEDDSTDGGEDMTAYIVGGALLAGGILAVALSSGDDEDTPAPTPTPPPAPTNAVAFSSAATGTIAENAAITTTVVDVNATATATGGTAGAVTFTLGGADAALFSIDPATGIVTLRNSANFETRSTYSITVTATSAANGTVPAATATQTIAVTVTNVNEQPTFTSATATATVVENAAITTPVFTAMATDPDAGTTLTYTLGGADAAAFTISAAGVVSLRAPADFETKSSYTFTVTAADAATGGLSSTQTVTLNVTNVNEAPTFSSGATATVAENVAAGTTVYTPVTVDPEGTARTFTLSGTDAAAFTINATTGVVTINASPDFETKASYSFTVTASDGVNSTPQVVALTVTDIAVEGPPTVTVSLDGAGPFSGLGTAGAAQATVFTDDLTRQSNATITGFGRDDIVRFSSAADVRFSSDAAGLTIEFNNSGTVSQIRIAGVVGPDAIITSEASAEAAVNTFLGTTGVDYFRFG